MVDYEAINALYTVYKNQQQVEDHIYFVKPVNKEELEAKIVKESVEKQILTPLTAYICVDESIADEVLKSKQKDEKQKILIDPMNPKGHSNVIKVSFNCDDISEGSSDLYED